ncbi:MAG: UxaA family hydrolase, partial [Lachnospiraceae bacterium]|nr:UxaA family hydrolase [Lachnospiraceae bacterium]
MKDFMKIHEEDNVIVALRDLAAGTEIALEDGSKVTVRQDVPAGHKMAIRDVEEGGDVIKYGARIGNAKEQILAGQWVHVHNLKTALGDLLEYVYEPVSMVKDWGVKDAGEGAKAFGDSLTFQGFLREDGTVGVRKEIWIIPTVGCVNNVATALAKKANAYVHGSVEEVIAFPHPYGCSQMGDDQENTRRVLADLIHHPNAGGVLVLGLGCENCNIPVLMPYLEKFDEKRVRFLVCQEVEDEMEEGEKLLRELIDQAAVQERQTLPASKLIVGMKCGGSDGFSGITANPLVGRFSDLLIAAGGTTILT